MKFNLTIILLLLSAALQAQFAPQAGLIGSTALHRDSSIFVAWGDSCNVHRGWIDGMDTSLGKTTNGILSDALGKPDNAVISLGDKGEVLYFFQNPIQNGLGYDFAIFENGFNNPNDSNMAYLELATVEVSSDGVFFLPFAATSLTDTSTQVAGVGQYMDCRKINNLAGKYIANFGTPFDLDELTLTGSLDVNNIHYIRIRDVTGNLHNDFCTRDASNSKINDPYPTSFPTGGFDLDGIGIIHTNFPTVSNTISLEQNIHLYPNPARDFIYFTEHFEKYTFKIYSLDSKLVQQGNSISNGINVSKFPIGSYLIQLTSSNVTKAFIFTKWD